MTRLDGWLEEATRRLASDSAKQVRREIQEHYEAAREVSISNGAAADEADRLAVAALGDAKTANCQYRKVLLTAAEARLLRDGNREARMVCARPWLRRLVTGISAAAMIAAAACFFFGLMAAASILLAVGLGSGFMFVAPMLPIYTPTRARIFRGVKWAAIVGALGLVFGPDAVKWSWLLICCLWPMALVEWRRVSLRRKLPVKQWPKQLYL